MGAFIILHWGAAIIWPARWRHNMAPRGRMPSFSEHLCHLHSVPLLLSFYAHIVLLVAI